MLLRSGTPAGSGATEGVAAGLRYRVLGPAGIVEDGVISHPRSVMVRGLLVALLAAHGRTVVTYRLLETLWTDPPGSAEPNLRSYATGLRRSLPTQDAGRLLTRRGSPGAPGGYALAVPAESCDLHVFRSLMAQGRRVAATDPATAAHRIRQALGLWRGPVGTDLPDSWRLRSWAAGLDAERARAVQDLSTVSDAL